jgi:adenine-specific DNA-methyltransferase
MNADIVYIDPPYNSRQYSRFYHVLETLTLWDKPKLSGVALKRPSENMSDYCRSNAPVVFADLIKNINAKYIVVSYNNTYNSKSNSSRNKIELEDIKSTLDSKGKTKIFKKDHQFFNAGKTNFNNHQEYLFITKVK